MCTNNTKIKRFQCYNGKSCKKKHLFFFFYRIILVFFLHGQILVLQMTHLGIGSVHFSYINEGLSLKLFQFENGII